MLPRKRLASSDALPNTPPNTPTGDSTSNIIASLTMMQLGQSTPSLVPLVEPEMTEALAQSISALRLKNNKNAARRRTRVHVRKPYTGIAIRLFADETTESPDVLKKDLTKQFSFVLDDQMDVRISKAPEYKK